MQGPWSLSSGQEPAWWSSAQGWVCQACSWSSKALRWGAWLARMPCSSAVRAQQLPLDGVQVTFTDRASVLPLLRKNVAQNARENGAHARCAA